MKKHFSSACSSLMPIIYLPALQKKLILFVALLYFSLTSFVNQNHSFFTSIKDFGATGDGKTVDTKAINDAIDATVKNGGGTVYFPAGIYLSFSIHLKSNIALYFEQGCVLLAADSTASGKFDDAEPNEWGDKYQYQDYGHSHWHNSLIWGENLENISILGPGIINGAGLRRGASARRPWGNKSIALKLCRNVNLKDFTILNGGHFGILATGVDNMTIDNLRMDTNRDGMDIDCCSNVRISNCTINSPWDDAICLKSSYGLGYLMATENVTITNCQVSGYDLGTFYNGTYQRKEWNRVPDKQGPTGRIKFGTESNGGFKNITISNCVFDYCRGFALETVDGGLLENVAITNITMRDIVNAPIFLRLASRMRTPINDSTIGALRRVMISNVMVYNADSHFASIISGVPEKSVEDVQLNNIRIYYRQMDSAVAKIPAIVPENSKGYPEPANLGIMPAYGFFIRHAKNIQLNNVEVSFMGEETRPAFVIDDVKGIDMFRVKAQAATGVKNFVLKNVERFSLKDRTDSKERNFEKLKTTSF
ncbi:MAG: glycoside hydrolase family 28 protein [Bacteroidota bacterium]|nr:glycoside hydrolase family 28 protein [Bacteroidota bacterium]